MKKYLLSALVLVFSQIALADGFKCKVLDGGSFSINVYNHRLPSYGTRSAAVMIISDNLVSRARKTVAVFRDVNSTLAQSGAHYTAVVDLRYLDSSRKGERVFGTKLGYIKYIDLDINFVYGQKLKKGASLSAAVTVHKRNGENYILDATCERYLVR
jgi:hypothetical protein